MRTIKLYGELGKKFGKVFKLDVKSPSEAIRALCMVLDGFENFLLGAEKNGLAFKVFDSNSQLERNQLSICGNGVIKIVPVVCGANAESRVIVGAVLIAVSYVMTATGYGAAAAPYVMNAGIAIAAGGALEMIVGRPKGPEIQEKEENKPSYNFSGAVNTTAQGHPVPLGYGRMIVGSAVISAAISTQNLMAGYVRKTRTITKDISALNNPKAYNPAPPPNWTKRELLGTENVHINGVASTRYNYRFFYTQEYMELAEL